MSALVERIEARIKERGTNFKRVEQACGLGNGTIKRWNEQSPRLDKLMLVSEYLQLSLDYIVYGSSETETGNTDETHDPHFLERKQHLMCDGSPLVEDEADLIAMYRLLPDHQQEDVFDFTEMKYRKHVERKKESIYWTYKEDRAAQKSGPAEDDNAQDGTA